MLYVVWTATENEDGTCTLHQFPYLVKTNYFGDTFVVKFIDNSIEAPQTRIYNISPLGMQDEQQHNPPMSFTYLINYILIEKLDGTVTGCVNQMTKASPNAQGFNIKQEGGVIHLDLSAAFLKRLCEGAFGDGTIIQQS